MLRRMAMTAIFSLAALTACGQPAQPESEATNEEALTMRAEGIALGQFYLVLPAVRGRPGALYGSMRGGSQDDTLTAIRIDDARVELHETLSEGGRMQMIERPDFAIPAESTVELSPGGLHGMAFDLPPTLVPGSSLDVVLIFENAGEQTIAVQTLAPGTMPTSMGGSQATEAGMKHSAGD
ncbi:copper chaperone PCu(A)C [Pacificimonas sp. ICDLI1SI03]